MEFRTRRADRRSSLGTVRSPLLHADDAAGRRGMYLSTAIRQPDTDPAVSLTPLPIMGSPEDQLLQFDGKRINALTVAVVTTKLRTHRAGIAALVTAAPHHAIRSLLATERSESADASSGQALPGQWLTFGRSRRSQRLPSGHAVADGSLRVAFRALLNSGNANLAVSEGVMRGLQQPGGAECWRR